jgi:hypothetical protein
MSFFRLLIRFRDRNWLEFLAVLDATFSMEESAVERVEEARKFFSEIAELDGRKDRSGPLALLELEKRARERSISEGAFRISYDQLLIHTYRTTKTPRSWRATSSRISISLVTKLVVSRT